MSMPSQHNYLPVLRSKVDNTNIYVPDLVATSIPHHHAVEKPFVKEPNLLKPVNIQSKSLH